MLRQIANWFHRRKLESGLDRELSYHVQRRTIDLEKSGLPAEEARRRVLAEPRRRSTRWLLHAVPVRHPERLLLIDWEGDSVANGFGS